MPNPVATQTTSLTEWGDRLYEVVDGHFVELEPMGVYETKLASRLLIRIGDFAEQHDLGHAVAEMLFDLTTAIARKRRPDVALVSFQRWPKQQSVPRTEAWEVVPNLAIEVMSATNSAQDVVDRVAEYFRAGVERVWLIFPSQSLVYVYQSPTAITVLDRQEVLVGDPVLPGFKLPLGELFE